MSKNFTKIASLLAPSNNQLFDRYVNVRLYQDYSTRQSMRGRNITDIVIKTPRFGQKPNITVSASMSQTDALHTITVTIGNINANIDFNAYSHIEVELGYMNSGLSRRFYGQIINCYMAKPNPNGELVITASRADMSVATQMQNYNIKFNQDTVPFNTFINTIASQVRAQLPSASGLSFITQVDQRWNGITFSVNKGSYQFNSLLSIITWMNSFFMAVAEQRAILKVGDISQKLPPILAYLEDDRVNITGVYEKVDSMPVLKALTNIGSAFVSGDSVGTITCPYNPEIDVGEFIYVDPKYFKTRIGLGFAFNGGNLSKIWSVNTMQFTFSTYTANNMILQLNNSKSVINYGG